ncbi:MAG: hypothetical protein M0Z89_08095 [Nitrospiraceae bacterium]|nr:hypothetical protein [Nitrospiraceae bacterium]
MTEVNNSKSEPRTRADLLRKTLDPVDILLKYLNSGFRGITGSPFNFCRVLCEMTEGMSGDRKGDAAVYGWYTLGGQKKDIIQFKDNHVYEIIYEINGEITLHAIEQKEYQRIRLLLSVHPLSVLISKFEMEKEYKAALDIFKRKQNEEKQRQEAEKRRSEQEDGIERRSGGLAYSPQKNKGDRDDDPEKHQRRDQRGEHHGRHAAVCRRTGFGRTGPDEEQDPGVERSRGKPAAKAKRARQRDVTMLPRPDQRATPTRPGAQWISRP